MGHLPIVNQETLKLVIEKGCIETKGKINNKIVETAASMFGDVLATRKGDLVFPWIVDSDESEGLGFQYVFRIGGDPVFVRGEEFPIKIPLESKGLRFDNPVSEAEALDLFDKKLLWNAIGKKSLGFGHSFSHQTLMEDEKLLDLLKSKNKIAAPTEIKLGSFSDNGQKITISTLESGDNKNMISDLISRFTEDQRLSNLNLHDIKWRDGNQFVVEKALEAWLMENIDKPTCNSLRKILFGDEKTIPKWFGNYLPFGVQGSNIDIVISENNNFIYVLELKRGKKSNNQIEEATKQVLEYSNFIKRAFNAFDFKTTVIPVVISNEHKKPKPLPKNLGIRFILYSIKDNGTISFKESDYV